MLLRMNGFPISSGFGVIDSAHKLPHSGVDIAIPVGTPLNAVTDGVVTKIDMIGGQSIGKMIRVEMEDGTDVVYGHLSKANVSFGQHVHAGDVIAWSGNTGHSTGPHVHLQMISENGMNIDPTAYASGIAEPGKSGLDRLNDFADWFVGKETETIFKPVTKTIIGWIKHIFDALNANSAEIITLGIIVCAAGMMVGPLVGSGSKWFGRLFVVFLCGVIWRVVLI